MVPGSPGQASAIRSVFVSYSREDAPRVDGLDSLLRGLGLQVFLDRRGIVAGDRWEDALESALSSAHAMVVVWSRHAARSKWVRREYETALQRGVRVVPVSLDDTPLSDALEPIQKANLLPLVNELLALQKQLRAQGVSRAGVREAVRRRLREEGIELDERRLNAILIFTGGTGAGLLSRLLGRSASRLTEGSLTMSGWGVLATAAALLAGGVALAGRMQRSGPSADELAAERAKSQQLQAVIRTQTTQLVDVDQVRIVAQTKVVQRDREIVSLKERLSQCRPPDKDKDKGTRVRQTPPRNVCQKPADCPNGSCVAGACVAGPPPPPPPTKGTKDGPSELPKADPPTSPHPTEAAAKTELPRDPRIRGGAVPNQGPILH